jgi:hypothetical protein
MKKICVVALFGLLFLISASVPLWGAEGQRIGSVTAVEGEVWLGHEGEKALYPAMLGDSVYLKDHIQTEKDSRVQILFEDESLLNLAENTTIQITEHIYSPQKSWRSSVFRVVMGKVRAVVGRYFAGAGSKYRISTPTAIIGVRGTHFIVDATLTDETTVVCIDTERDLVVGNIEDGVPGEVTLTGGLMTKVLEGQAPTSPAAAPEDLMIQLLMDTKVALPALQSGPGALNALGKKAAVTELGVIERGKMPPIPVAPDEPIFIRVLPPQQLPELPPPPPPPPQK